MIKKAIMPYPQQICDSGKCVRIGEPAAAEFRLSFRGCSKETENLLKDTLCAKFAVLEPFDGNYQIELKVDASDDRFKEHVGHEAYYISITDKKAVLCGAGDGGAYYATLTFASLIQVNSKEVCLPIVEIFDYPKYKTRGIFIESRFNDLMSLEEWYGAVDYFAAMKYNTMIIGVYGCWSMQYDHRLSQYLYIPIKKYPQLKTPKNFKYYSPSKDAWIYKKEVLPTMYEQDFLGDIIKYAKARNVQVIPLFNSLGHNTLIPGAIPEISVKDENGVETGFGMCMQNEKTYEVMFSIYDEIIDRYLSPNDIKSIAIGLDEVQNGRGIDKNDLHKEFSPICKCEKCRKKEFAGLMAEYVIKILKYLKGRGMENVYLYHDMLAKHGLLNEEFADRLREEGVYDITVIDWWNYHNDYEKFCSIIGNKMNSLFRGIIKPMTGYENWINYMDSSPNEQICMEQAEKFGLEGVISYASYEHMYDINYRYIAECAWQWNTEGDYEEYSQRYFASNFPGCYSDAKRSWELIMRRTRSYEYDLQLPDLIEYSYYPYSYLNKDHDWPRDNVGELFHKIYADKRRYIDHLTDVYLRSKEALAFFESAYAQPSDINEIFADNCRVINVMCDEHLTLYFLNENYGNGLCDEAYFVCELDRLILARKRMMLRAEKVRGRSTMYHAMRNMSIMLEFLVSLREDFADKIQKGLKPQFDVENSANRDGALFKFLR